MQSYMHVSAGVVWLLLVLLLCNKAAASAAQRTRDCYQSCGCCTFGSVIEVGIFAAIAVAG
jgi:hypothetical protein